MSDTNLSNQSENPLDEILKELEERFGINSNQDDEGETGPTKKNKGINFKKFGQNQIIGGLTLVLLVVGAAVGIYLGQQSTELRQQAAYATCVSGVVSCIQNGVGSDCTPPSGGFCSLDSATGNCTCQPRTPTNTPVPTVCGAGSATDCVNGTPSVTNCSTGGGVFNLLGTCTLTGVGNQCACIGPTPTTIPQCTCNTSSDSTCIGKSTGATCTVNGSTSVCGGSFINGSLFCSCGGPIPPGCPGGSAPTATPTKTPVPATNTPVPPTNIPPTNPPATNTPVPPTNPPATNTPTRTPTPGGPTATRTSTPSPTPTRTPTITPGGPTLTPTRTPSLTPTSTIAATGTPAPTCNGITITYGTTTEPTRPVRIGDVLTFTCGDLSASGAISYQFRIFLNGVFLQNISPISTTSRVSSPFTIANSGSYSAQCRMCTDITGTNCQPWETP